ncbi:hypothetical protein GV67_21535 [Pseudorhizobium pelagicum]|uniref:Nuclease n=2 Tax=Pseudorhizobium pelagicum TaxID=1509405 RepID=A0A922NZ54_9HYPH|nr:hypothetical protein GV68_12310 [Pseudorhizobium pelagicum]KEQ07366.1 hypothetical protein GV67_21535 [Pseudorhizobium pelagicum]
MLLVVVLLFPGSLSAADASGLPAATKEAATKEIVRSARVVGRAAVVDGRTLWLPGPRMLVRLSDIDTCDLPQWSFDPHAATAGPSPAPVACGALAMAWLKRLVGDRRVTCLLDPGATGTVHVGVCRVGSLDLGREMLRVGWARLATGGASRPDDRAAQSQAIGGRHGIWGTYVLDMDEWRKKAVDRTLGRRPVADWNLLSTREREISPAFRDAHRQPRRRDR